MKMQNEMKQSLRLVTTATDIKMSAMYYDECDVLCIRTCFVLQPLIERQKISQNEKKLKAVNKGTIPN